MSLVFQNIDPHPPLRPASVSSPQQRQGVHTRRAERGVGGSIFWKTRDIGLASYSNNLSTGWALKIKTFLGPDMARVKRVPFGPKKVIGTLVIFCTQVLLCSVVVLLCVRGVGRSPCSCVGILAAVLCVLCGGIEGVGGGWQTH
jgi:hypothetical protein